MNMSARRWLRWLGEIALLVAVVVAINAWQTRATPVGVAPDFSGTLLDGTPVRLSDLRGRPVLLQFWATWCPVCGLEQGSINAIAKDHPVLSVAIDEGSAATVQGWMADKGVSYPVLHDPEMRIAGRYGIRGIPASFILDPAGNIRFAEAGYTSGIGLRVRLWWAGLAGGVSRM
jgi:peroxiredoxin